MPTELISAAKRKSLPDSKFALPEQKKYPIDTAARVRNAAARLEQQKGRLSSSDYSKARRRIAAAAKRFGIDSQYNEGKRTADLGPSDVHAPGGAKLERPKGMRVRAHIPNGGYMSIRHLRDDTYAFAAGGTLESTGPEVGIAETGPGSAIHLSDGESLRWIQLARPGAFKGHRAGAFELNAQVFTEIVRNFERDGMPVPVDHEHQSEVPAGELGEDGAPAMGWIQRMRIVDGNLYGLVQWTAKGAQQVRDGQYKFFSPAIRFNSKDRVTGEIIGARMTSGAMTNSPFLTGMQPLAAKDGGEPAGALLQTNEMTAQLRGLSVYRHDAFAQSLRAALRVNELCSMAECSEQLGRLRGLYDMAEASGLSAYSVVEGVDLSVYTDALRSLANVPGNANVGQLLDAVEEMIDAALARHNALYHAGEEPDMDDAEMDDEEEDGAPMAATDEGDGTMTTAANPEIQAKMKDYDDKLTALTARLEKQEQERGTLELRLKAAEAKTAEKDAEIVELSAKLAVAEKAEVERVERESAARVEEAFLTHKDAHKLTDRHKKSMLLHLKSDPKDFEELYPRVTPDQRHLLRVVAAGGHERVPAAGEGAAVGISLRELSHKIARERKIPLAQAQLEAERIVNANRRAG